MAVKTKPIKNELFKFVTLRTPQLIDEKKKDIGFIFHKDNVSKESNFIKEISLENDLVKAREIVITKVREFKPLERLMEVKAINREMYQFSSWLMHNRNVIIKKESIEQMQLVSKPTLTITQENLLWDNLYYQVLTHKSSYVRQACIQMLIAHNFLNKATGYKQSGFNGSEDDYLKRIANAKVVIDKSFTKEDKKQPTNKFISKTSLKKLEEDTKKHYLKNNVNLYQSVLSEISGLEYDYNKAYHKARKIALEKHKVIVDSLIKSAEAKIKPLQYKENLAASKENRIPVTIPLDVDLPKFKFDFDSPFSKKYLSKLSKSTQDILIAHNIIENVPIKDAKSSIQNRIDINNKKLFSLVKTNKTHAFVNGVRVQSKKTGLNPYCYLVRIVPAKGIVSEGSSTNEAAAGYEDITYPEDILDNTNGAAHTPNNVSSIQTKKAVKFDKFIFKINLGNEGAIVASQIHHLTRTIQNNDTTITVTTPEFISLVNGELTINLFPNRNLIITIFETLNLTGQFTLNNGTVLNYNIAIDPVIKMATGCADVDISNADNAGSSETPTPTVDVNLYGVSRIGVADFRKVEQTVCCYEAGEVSHIENVMAKEFKKRETRNFTSSERTSEATSETEVENLTDTTTTERNELQTEVSKVLNEDRSQNYGASAEVHGGNTAFGFSASGHADFANSSASSQSNTQAQTYAQEITERALERVVTKTSKKQTSRILKEFEEFNQHGFDNRKGEQHVSGVYRWIDIIYTNQLVNYGKRLMYEFMVPEPARFFRDAIVLDTESSKGIMTIEEPIHPSKLEAIGIDNATLLDKDNYLKLASAYDVEIKPIPEKYIVVNKTFSNHNGDIKRHAGNMDGSVKIPEKYKAIEFYLEGGYSNKRDYAKYSINVANENISGDSEVSYESRELNNITDNVSIAIAIDRYYSFTLGVSIKCQRTSEALEKWQNETYKVILDGYYEQVERYNSFLAMNDGDGKEMKFSNLFNRILEKREIKRICVEMLARPYKNPIGQDNYASLSNSNPNDYGINRVNQTPEFEHHAAHVKFFEQAFEWDIMAYKFYDYFWANKEKWVALFQETSNADPIFQAFLQSGMARAVVPVRPGFEDAVLYYMDTGDIWNGGDLVIDQDNDLYISIAEEMQSVEGAVEKEWESRVPTALTMIQKDTVGLQETGLPCCNEEGLKPEEKPIQGLQALIGGNNPIVDNPKV